MFAFIQFKFLLLFCFIFVRDIPKMKKSSSEPTNLTNKEVSMTTTCYSLDEDVLVLNHEVTPSGSSNYFQIAGKSAIAGAKRASKPVKR